VTESGSEVLLDGGRRRRRTAWMQNDAEVFVIATAYFPPRP
jgi:hypothetical protein